MFPTSLLSALNRQWGHRRSIVINRPPHHHAIVLLALAGLAACGQDHAPANRQVVARVNGQEITVHQLKNEFAPFSALGAAADQTPTREMLDSLIDEELLVEQGKQQKLDRDPQLIQADEKARRQNMVRAVQNRAAASLPQPGVAEVRAFYEANPALFAKRRLYTFRQFTVDRNAFTDALKSKLDQAKTRDAVVAALKANNVELRELVSVRAAEQLPMDALPVVATMNRGDVAVINDGNDSNVLQLMDFVEQSATLEQAAPIIREYLINAKKRELVTDLLKTLRASAKIEYVGAFAKDAATTAQSAPAGDPASTTQPEHAAEAKDAAGQKPASAEKEAGGTTNEQIRKGMQSGRL